MSIAARITINDRQMAALQRELKDFRGGLGKAIAGGVNKTLAKGRTFIVGQMKEKLNVRPRLIAASPAGKPRITVRKATERRLGGSIWILNRPIGLINFGAKDTRPKKLRGSRKPGSGGGVLAQIYRDGSKQVYPHAFIAKGRNNNQHVFQRAEKPVVGRDELYVKGSKSSPGRYPIGIYRGVSLFKVYNENPRITKAVIDFMQADLGKQLLSQVDRILARRKVARPADLESIFTVSRT